MLGRDRQGSLYSGDNAQSLHLYIYELSLVFRYVNKCSCAKTHVHVPVPGPFYRTFTR